MRQLLFFTLILLTAFSSNSQTPQEQWVQCNNKGCKLLDQYFVEGVTFTWDGECKDGKAHGIGKATKFKNGEFESSYEGNYLNGVRQGRGKFTFKGNVVREGNFINGELIGRGKYYDESGRKYEGDFMNYFFHGNGILSYPNGSKFEGFFVSDAPYTGKFTNYDGKVSYIQSGNPVEKIKEEKSNYHPKINEQNTEYFDENWKRCDAKKAAFYRLITYETENKPKGKIRDFYINGQLQSEFYCTYLDYDDEGKMFHIGEGIWYYKSGKIEQKRTYSQNRINGKQTFWYENGQKASEANYEVGILNGYYYQWYQSGKMKLKALYENGELADDRYLEFDENGLSSTVYKERFLKNKQSWEVKSDGSESTIDGAKNIVLLKNKEKGTTSRFAYITFNQNGSYSIEGIIDRRDVDKNIGTGLLFGFKDWDNYYQFLISGDNRYAIFGRFQGITITVSNWTFSGSINNAKNNQRNLLKVLKLGDEFIFSINGQIVARQAAKTLSGNNVGMITGGKGEIALENIVIKEFTTGDNSIADESKNKRNDDDDWKGNGSGFFISEKGYIATNYHVIKDAESIQVVYFEKGIKRVYKARVIKSDKQNDLSIIKIDDPTYKNILKIPYFFSTSIADVGTSVFALGYPMLNLMGEEIKFTDGKISSKTGFQGDITVYQISVPIQPGNSGGPLFDNDGNLIGITSSGLRKDISDNVNYAIKTTYLKNLIDVLPEKIDIPNDKLLSTKSLTDKIKILTDYIPIIRIK